MTEYERLPLGMGGDDNEWQRETNADLLRFALDAIEQGDELKGVCALLVFLAEEEKRLENLEYEMRHGDDVDD